MKLAHRLILAVILLQLTGCGNFPQSGGANESPDINRQVINVYINGCVERGGTYSFNSHVTLLDIIQTAGLRPTATLNGLLIHNERNPGVFIRFYLETDSIGNIEETLNRIQASNGDVIYIPLKVDKTDRPENADKPNSSKNRNF